MIQNSKNTAFRFALSALFVLFLFSGSLAQKPMKVRLIKADDLRYDKSLGEKVQRLIGNVILKHDSTLLFCDSAYLNEETNSFDGFGNVHIKASDTLNIYSSLLNYNGNTRVAELHHEVRLVDSKATLTTDHLWYDRESGIAYYTTGGKIVDSSNVLTSIKGYYYTETKEAYFRDSVELVNKRYVMITDTMMYHTEKEISYFYGPTTITSEENVIYCENGWYDTQNDKSRFTQNAYLITKEQKLSGDSLYYDRLLDYGEAFNNVSLVDTVQDMIIYGHYGEFQRSAGHAFVTDSAVAVLADKTDSLFLHSDTLFIQFDSEQKVEFMFGYYHTKFFRKDLQGMCDSLVYNFGDSTIFLYNSPVLWSDINQLTADSVRIALANNNIDTLALIGSSFIISMDDTISRSSYNQIKGKVMTGYFNENQLVKIKVNGNSETLYYIREEDGSLIGINIAYASDMMISLMDSEVQSISYINMPDAHLYPDHEVEKEDRLLKGFKWIDDKRPIKKEDIFIW